MSRDWRLRLDDVVQYGREAVGFVAGVTYEEFASDLRTQRAVVYSLLVVGEATKHVPDDVRARAPRTDWVGAMRFRDRVAHGYDAIDLPTVWRIVHEVVPGYVAEVAALTAELDAEMPPGDRPESPEAEVIPPPPPPPPRA